MGGCRNYDLFFGSPRYWVPFYNRDPKRDHNFDNHPYRGYKGVIRFRKEL